MRKGLRKLLIASIFVSSLAFFDCKSTVKNYPIDYVDRNAAFPPDKSRKPSLLVVEIKENGKLSLNRIETGTISDVSLLSEKLEVIFADRERNSNQEKEVVIDPHGEIKKEDLKKLIESLKEVKASPIRVIRNGLHENVLQTGEKEGESPYAKTRIARDD